MSLLNGLFEGGCVVCSLPADTTYRGNDYCEPHFQQRIIRETEQNVEYPPEKQHGQMNSIGLDTN